MKNKISRTCAPDCHWFQTNWPKMICSTDTEFHSQEWQDSTRDHLATCAQCREEIGSYFLPELWELEFKPRDPTDSSLAGPVLERLGIYIAPENPSRIPSNYFKVLKSRGFFPRIQPLIINFVTTAVIILTLTCTGYFGLLPQLENGVKTLGHQVGTAFDQTQTNGVKEFKTFWTGLEHVLKDPFHLKTN
ncbi:MAG TPA: hypothetical protein VHY08_13925 [Bacillota bacterium]|nr:hypothetical protein [Bacillota bacterium]